MLYDPARARVIIKPTRYSVVVSVLISTPRYCFVTLREMYQTEHIKPMYIEYLEQSRAESEN